MRKIENFCIDSKGIFIFKHVNLYNTNALQIQGQESMKALKKSKANDESTIHTITLLLL